MPKSENAKDWSQGMRVAIAVIRLMQGDDLSAQKHIEEFGICRRQVYRDVACIKKAIQLEQHRQGHWRKVRVLLDQGATKTIQGGTIC
jgi:hypothetical protein